ncbi:Cnl2/NKP2 family protein-domain-containing protein [Peziza echinospora]|nr:Cnl2/NKP2 family protein-domain-containing protein [Peziza echinospora]
MSTNPPAPTTTPSISQREQTILTTFLLPRATLPHILPLTQFTKLFPQPHQSNPQIKHLYRHLQSTRSTLLDRVQKTIELEVLQGKRQRARANKSALIHIHKQNTLHANTQKVDEVDIGIELFGTTVNHEPIIPLKELLAQMEDAVQELAEEERRLEEMCKSILKDMQEAVGDLSDLRYGKFSTQGIEGKVIDQLRNLAQTCDGIIAEKDGIEDDDDEDDEENDDVDTEMEDGNETVS